MERGGKDGAITDQAAFYPIGSGLEILLFKYNCLILGLMSKVQSPWPKRTLKNRACPSAIYAGNGDLMPTAEDGNSKLLAGTTGWGQGIPGSQSRRKSVTATAWF